MKYWFPDIPAAIWSGIFLIVLFTLNYLSTRSYGESEFIFAGIKVLTVLVFLFAGTLLILGLGPEPSPGFTNWTIGDAPFVGGFTAMLGIFMVAGFSFQGTEMIGIAAGESEDPEKNVPRAVKSIFWRILLFYLGAFIVIGFLIPYTDPNLLNTEIENISVAAAASVMNAVILTAVLSAGNSGLYVSTRMLYAMAETGQAPKCFLKLNKRGVPSNALFATVVFGLAAFLTSLIGEGKAYDWLVNISGMAGFITLPFPSCLCRTGQGSERPPVPRKMVPLWSASGVIDVHHRHSRPELFGLYRSGNRLVRCQCRLHWHSRIFSRFPLA